MVSTRRVILFVDDEKLPLSTHMKGVEAVGYKAEYCKSPVAAFEFIVERKDDIAAFVLDSMMPYAPLFDAEQTKDGFFTGIMMISQIQALCPSRPILLLTDLSKQEILEAVKSLPPLERSEALVVRVLTKDKCDAMTLVKELRSLLGSL